MNAVRIVQMRLIRLKIAIRFAAHEVDGRQLLGAQSGQFAVDQVELTSAN